MTPLSKLPRWLMAALGVAVGAELLLLRTGTRTAIHIPGLGQFDTPLGAVAEVGRFAFYLALVLVIAFLLVLAYAYWQTNIRRDRSVALLVLAYVLVAVAGRSGLLGSPVVGWLSASFLVAVTSATWLGVRSVPLALFTVASFLATWSVLGQGSGGGLSAQSVDALIIGSETLLVLAGVTSPLLAPRRVTRGAVVAGSIAFGLVLAGFSVGGSTLSILTLWNLGVPGWLSPLAYGLAFAGIVVTIWTSITRADRVTTVAMVLLVAGGVGSISTYQTALVLTAVLLVGTARLKTKLNADYALVFFDGDRKPLQSPGGAFEPELFGHPDGGTGPSSISLASKKGLEYEIPSTDCHIHSEPTPRRPRTASRP